MGMKLNKILYGLLFVVLLPLFLVLFCVTVPVPFAAVLWPLGGGVATGAGMVVMLLGMLDLWRRGEGPPMNAFPPKKLVTGGIYAVLPHPIYLGFCVLCLGLSLWAGSATGLYLATPLVALGCVALVVGLERLDLKRRFGATPDPVLGPSRLLRPLSRVLGLVWLWRQVLRGTEWLANSWRSRRFGKVRIMNHLVFSGLGGAVGSCLVVLAVGRPLAWAVSLLMLTGAAGGAVVGQILEGSSNKLSRPFGYFGALLGVLVAAGALSLFVPETPLVVAAFALAAPWTCAIGRLRCVVQGCCHGSPCPAEEGIVVRNEHSRVCGMAELGNQSIYPTQLYSSLGNIAIGVALAWTWSRGASLTLVMGLYLALSGALRFMEEAYRGEPQTRILGGLHIYQWFSVAMFLGGALVMLVPSPAVPVLSLDAWIPAVLVGGLFFAVCGFAMSVDFPDSNRKFTRLSG